MKLELDTSPPVGARFETRFITFPMTAAVTTASSAFEPLPFTRHGSRYRVR